MFNHCGITALVLSPTYRQTDELVYVTLAHRHAIKTELLA